jgi:hypothetical protein
VCCIHRRGTFALYCKVVEALAHIHNRNESVAKIITLCVALTHKKDVNLRQRNSYYFNATQKISHANTNHTHPTMEKTTITRTTTTSQTKATKNVRFESIEIIELAYTLGDNPAVLNGVPLTIEWEAQKRTTLSVSFFEKYRPPRCEDLRKLLISKSHRRELLLNIGYDKKELREASKEARRIRKSRRSSAREVVYREEKEPPVFLEYKEEEEDLSSEDEQQVSASLIASMEEKLSKDEQGRTLLAGAGKFDILNALDLNTHRGLVVGMPSHPLSSRQINTSALRKKVSFYDCLVV